VKDGLALEKLKDYRPSEKEPFMTERQREYFRAKLLSWKDEILRVCPGTSNGITEFSEHEAD
jgi:DnaK suppressor protein